MATNQGSPMTPGTHADLVLTAIMRDDSAVAAGVSEQSTFRTVRFPLTPEQCAALQARGSWEVISQVIVEATK